MAQIGLAIKGIIAFASANTLNAFVVNTALSVGMSLVSQALSKRQQSGNNGGITINRPTVGDTTPGNIVFGYYATPGNFTAPPYTRGRSGDTPNAFLTTILDVSDVPIKGFKPVIWIGEDRVELEESAEADSHYAGRMIPVTGSKYRGHIWVKFYNGNQTAVDPHMIATAAGSPRPWTENMIGRGIAYAIIHTKYESELFSSEPDFLFEVEGALLYDPRKDSTNGGSGPHRYGIVNTYEYTENPVVMIYNIMRGIPLPDGSTWGGRAEAADLPNSTWFAAMNKCDIPRPGDGLPTYRAGYNTLIGPEEFQGHEPAGVIEELMTACAATIAEIEGGVWGIRVGAPDLPVAFITDDDIIISENEFFDPFPGIEEIINGVQSQYPSVEERWVSKQAPTRYSLAFEAEDRGRRNLANVSMPAVTDLTQVQMLQKAFVEDARRFRRHEITLPPDFAHITPLDSIGWNSDRYGYINNKTFEIAAKALNSKSLNSRMTMRERDSGDFAWQVSDKLPSVVNSPAPIEVETQYGVPGEHWAAYIITDAAGTPRRPGAVLTWAMDGVADVIGISWQVRPLGSTALVNTGTTQDVRGGRQIMSEGFTAGGHYEGRAKVEAPGRRTDWGQWVTFIVDDIRLGVDDIEADIIQDLEDLKAGLDEAFDDVEDNRQDITDLVAAAAAQAQSFNDQIDDLADDLVNEAAAIRGEIVVARNDISGDMTALAATLRGEMGPAVQTGIQDYDITVQGQFDAMVGQIQQLTAMLASLELLQDGNFVASVADPVNSVWTRTGSVSFEDKATSTHTAAAASSPELAFVRLASNGTIKQRTSSFDVVGGEVFSIRFAANCSGSSALNRDVLINIVWFDVLGAQIGAASQYTINVSFNAWAIFSHEFEAPDNAVEAEITFSRPSATGGNLFLTSIKANTVNKSLEAEITELQGTLVNLQTAFASHQTTILSRMGNAETAITSEAGARVTADNALGVRIDTITSEFNTAKATIASNTTAIADANASIASVETDIRSQFGVTQLVRDPDFFRGTTYWQIPTPANLFDRDKNSGDWWLRDAPGRKFYGFTGNQSTSQYINTVLQGDFAPGEKFDLGFYGGRSASTSPNIYILFRFFKQDGTYQDFPFSFNNIPVGSYSYQSVGSVTAPAGTVSSRIYIRRNGGAGNAVDRTYVTGFTVSKWAAGDALSDSRIQTISDTVADDVAALAAYKTTVNTRFNSNELAITNEITNRTTADNALGGRIDTLTGRVGANETKISTVETGLVNANEAIAQSEFNITTQVGNAQKVRDPEFSYDYTYWAGDFGPASIILRNYANTSWIVNSMPGAKALRFQNSPTGARHSPIVEINPNAFYDLAFYAGRLSSGSVGVTVMVQWFAANDGMTTPISTNTISDVKPAVGKYYFYTLTDIEPPAGARFARVVILPGTGGNTSWTYITRITLTEQGAFERAASAEFAEAFLAISTVDTALTNYKTQNNTRVGNVETSITQEVTARSNADTALTNSLNALTTRVGTAETRITNETTARTNADNAFTSSLNALTTRVGTAEGKVATNTTAISNLNTSKAAYEVATNAAIGRINAGGRLRIYSLAAFSGGVSRVGLTAEAAGASAATAGIFLEAKSDGTSAVYIDANRLAFVNGPGTSATRTTPFFIEGGKTYIASAVIKEATIGTLHLGVGAAVTGVSATYNIDSNSGWTTRNLVIPVFSTGSRLLVLTDGTINPRYSPPAYGRISLLHNGITKEVGSSRTWTYIYGDGLTGTGHAAETVSNAISFNPSVAGNNTVQVRILGHFVGNVTVLEIRKSR